MNIHLKKIIQFWQLTIILAKVNFKIKTEGSYLGIFWHFLNPLLSFLTLYFIFKNLTGQNIEQYPTYLLSGIIMFRFFQSVTTEATAVIPQSESAIRSLKFNFFVIPRSVVVSNLFSHAVEMFVMILFLSYLNLLTPVILYYPLVLALLTLFVTGLACFLSAVAVVFRDTDNIWSNAVRIIWFGTPIFYAASINPTLEKINLLANPMFYFIEIMRTLIINNRWPDSSLILPAVLFTAVSLAIGLIVFNSLKRKFSECL